MNPYRLAACLAGLWAGAVLGIGAIGAPAAFAAAVPDVAGRVAGRMFSIEAYLSLLLGIVLFLLMRKQAGVRSEAGTGSLFSGDMLIALGTLFCTVAGHFALVPMMAEARAGHGALSFAALHAISAGFFGLKGLLLVVLAWRLTSGAGPTRRLSPPPSS